MMTLPSGPFADLRVVEFGQLIAVPYCGQLLADCGADVIKVEPLSGDPSRGNAVLPSGDSRQFLNKNRGKRSCALDLSRQEVTGIVDRLVRSADIVLSNFRPGTAERLGLDYDRVAAVNPRVIYAANTAFGPAGPQAGAVGVDVAVQAYAGLWQTSAEGPIAIADPVVDYTAALLMSFGVAAALYHRERTGLGQRLDTTLLQAALLLQNNHLVAVQADDDWRSELCTWLRDAFAGGSTWTEVLERRSVATRIPLKGAYGIVRTADGYLAVGGFARDARDRLRVVLEAPRPEDLQDSGTADGQFASRTTREWLADLEAARIPAAPLQFPEQIMDDPQVHANGYLTTVEHDRVGQLRTVGPPLRMSATALAAQRPPPDLGAQTAELLAELGVSDEEVHRLAKTGAISVLGQL